MDRTPRPSPPENAGWLLPGALLAFGVLLAVGLDPAPHPAPAGTARSSASAASASGASASAANASAPVSPAPVSIVGPATEPTAGRALDATRRAAPAPLAAVRVETTTVGGVEVAARELILRPRADYEASLDARLLRELGAERVDAMPFGRTRRVVFPEGTDIRATRSRLAALPEVEHVGWNHVVRGAWHGRGARVGRRADWSLRATGLAARGARGRHSPRLVVAVLDSGVAPDAPGLRGVERVAPLDAIDGDDAPDDENGHGTFIANLIVGDPGLGGDAALMPVRVLDAELAGTEAGLVLGLHHAILFGADVVNLSLVFGADYVPSQLLDAAIAEALRRGVVVVGAAGNDAQPMVRYPAAFPGVLAVGASTPSGRRDLRRASYSSFGAALDLLAPGGDLDADENRDGLADGIVAESFDPAHPGVFGAWLYAGTSQAAAHVSAAAARLLADGVAPERVAHHLRARADEAHLPYAQGFDTDSGLGHLWVRGARGVHGEEPEVGAQLVAVLHGPADRPAIGAVIALVDRSGAPVVEARVHARFRGALVATGRCTTDAAGVCAISGGALAHVGQPVVIELEAAVLSGGDVARPRTVATSSEVSAALAAVDGAGFGPSSILWSVDSSFSRLYFPNALGTWMLFGTGVGSALPPTVVALDDASASLLIDDGTSGTGFGPSSMVWIPLTWSFSFSFSFSYSTSGVGFGPSSISWGGWTFLWAPRLTLYGMSEGSPIHDVTGAALGSAVAAGTSATGLR